MNVLGIETSCDETALSLVKDGKDILGDVLFSSLRYHRKFGGVVPEIASRLHLEVIDTLFEELLKNTRLKFKDIELVAVTSGPGLLGALLVGVSFAKALSFALKVPLVGVNHLYAHLYAAFLEKNRKLNFPFVGLVVSGGHTNLFYVEDFLNIQTLGNTLDDACGEALDKVARLLNLGYPGGPHIERLAKRGDPKSIHFSPLKTKNPFDFSFSGIKTAVMYYLRDRGYLRDEPDYQLGGWGGELQDLRENICACFQERIFDSLVEKSFFACKVKKTKILVVGGGVAVNKRLREKFFLEGLKEGIDVYFAPHRLCQDNATMVAGLGYLLFKKGKANNFDLKVHTE